MALAGGVYLDKEMVVQDNLVQTLYHMFLGFRISTPTLPCEISRSAMTVALSRPGSTNGADPIASCLARVVAANVMSNRLGILFKQSSTVIRAIVFVPVVNYGQILQQKDKK
jgi:hypothetical protein